MTEEKWFNFTNFEELPAVLPFSCCQHYLTWLVCILRNFSELIIMGCRDVTYVTASGSIVAAAGYSSTGVNVVVWDTLAPPSTSQASIMCHDGMCSLQMFCYNYSCHVIAENTNFYISLRSVNNQPQIVLKSVGCQIMSQCLTKIKMACVSEL